MNIYFTYIMEFQSETTANLASTTTSSQSELPPPPQTSAEEPPSEAPAGSRVRLADIEIDNEVTALNILVQFLGLAQKRGAFTIDEAAKIWECVKKFQRPLPDTTPKED
jgi:hypothetical protein